MVTTEDIKNLEGDQMTLETELLDKIEKPEFSKVDFKELIELYLETDSGKEFIKSKKSGYKISKKVTRTDRKSTIGLPARMSFRASIRSNNQNFNVPAMNYDYKEYKDADSNLDMSGMLDTSGNQFERSGFLGEEQP